MVYVLLDHVQPPGLQNKPVFPSFKCTFSQLFKLHDFSNNLQLFSHHLEVKTSGREVYGGGSSPEKDGRSLQLLILTGSLVVPQEDHEPLLLGLQCCFNISNPDLDLGLGGLCACLATN